MKRVLNRNSSDAKPRILSFVMILAFVVGLFLVADDYAFALRKRDLIQMDYFIDKACKKLKIPKPGRDLRRMIHDQLPYGPESTYEDVLEIMESQLGTFANGTNKVCRGGSKYLPGAGLVLIIVGAGTLSAQEAAWMAAGELPGIGTIVDVYDIAQLAADTIVANAEAAAKANNDRDLQEIADSWRCAAGQGAAVVEAVGSEMFADCRYGINVDKIISCQKLLQQDIQGSCLRNKCRMTLSKVPPWVKDDYSDCLSKACLGSGDGDNSCRLSNNTGLNSAINIAWR